MKNYSKKQIEDAICTWATYLLEHKLASEHEVRSMLDEGLFKRAKTGLKNIGKGIAHGIASGIKAVALKVHDTFAANAGVKQLMDAINKLLSKVKVGSKIQLWVHANGKTYPVAKFEISKNRSTLAFMFDEKTKKPLTYEDLYNFLKNENVTGDGHKISDYVDALICGQVVPSNVVNESVKSSDIGRIGRVLAALGWNDPKTATKKKNVEKIMALFGIAQNEKNVEEVKSLIHQHCKNAHDAASNEFAGSNDNSSKDKDDEPANKDSSTSSSSTPSASTSSNSSSSSTTVASNNMLQNTCLMKTKNGKVPVMDCPYQKIVVQNNQIALVFGLTKAEKQKRIDQNNASKT